MKGRGAPRVVHVTTTDISLALLLAPQLAAFSAAGYEVLGASAPGPFVARLESAGIAHIPLRHATRSVAPHRDLAALGELTALFRRMRPDVVHTHNPKPGVYGRLAAHAARVPAIVNTVHGLYALPSDPIGKRTLVYGLERLAAACSHAELVQNVEDLQTLTRLRIPASKLRLLGNGIDLQRFDPTRVSSEVRARVRDEFGVGPDELLVGAVGRLVAEKGYAELFAAWSQVRSPTTRLVVIGPSEPEKADALAPELIARARGEGVVFPGLRDDMVDLYAAMDVYVLASHREGFPRSAMEAAAMGVPVIATDIRGCRQVVDDGVTGRLVRLGDVGALGRALASLAGDAEVRARMSAAARAKAASEFDQQRVIDITLETYARLLA